MKVAIIHDDLVQWGGAERVLEGICEAFPDAPIYTSIFDQKNNELKNRFGNKIVITSFLQKIFGWKKLYKLLLPLYPIAFEQFDFSQFDLVISQSTRFAKCIITKPRTKHICYMHTPPRFLWSFSENSLPSVVKSYLKLMSKWDLIWSSRPDLILAGSNNASSRITNIYGQSSVVLYPFIDINRFNKFENFDGGYFLVITRLNKYKRVNLAIEACGKLGLPLKIIGIGPEFSSLSALALKYKNIALLGNVGDRFVAYLLSGARALIVPGEEDFGLASIEAQAAGKPVIAYGKGGALETVLNKKTGLFFDTQTVDNLLQLLENFDAADFNISECRKYANNFTRDTFIRNIRKIVVEYSK